jgi:signal transduction histidine kinase
VIFLPESFTTNKKANPKLIKLLKEISVNYYNNLIQGIPLNFSQIEVKTAPRFIAKAKLEHQIESLLMVPLIYQENYLGVICIYNNKKEKGRGWSEEKIARVSEIAKQIAMNVYQEKIKKNQSEPEKFYYDLTKELNSNLSSDKISEKIFKTIGDYLEIEQIILVRVEFEKESIEIDRQWARTERNCLAVEKYKNIIINAPREKISYQEIIERNQGYLLSNIPVNVKQILLGYLVLISQREQKIQEKENCLEFIREIITLIIEKEELNKRLEKLEEEENKIKTKATETGEFFSYMTHELRSPLAAILGFAKMLKEQLYGDLNDKQMQYVNAIAESGTHMLALVNNLLDLSKAEANKEELCLERVPIEEICLASLAMVEERGKEQGIKVILEIDSQLDFCVADTIKLKQILVNLLTNAIKFTEIGSVTLKVEKEKEMFAFKVIDTGIGIKQEDQEKLFEPFSQVNKRKRGTIKGTGLGLALSRKLARLHGGDIILVSEEGKGSCFTVTIPIKLNHSPEN